MLVLRRSSLAGTLSLLIVACGLATNGASPSDGGTDAANDANGPAGTSDSGLADAGPGPTDAAPPPRFGVTATTVYAGTAANLTAQIVGSNAGLALAWTVVSAPTGSGVTTASINGATTLTPTVPTDIAGTYTLAITGTSGTSVVASAQTTVTAVPATVFYVRTTIDTGGGDLALIAVGHDGSGSHAVACPSNFYSNQDSLAQQRTMLSGASLLDVWEGSPGHPSEYVLAGVTTLTADDAGDYALSLVGGTSTTTCASAPAALAQATAHVGALGQPRFSPDGSRVAYLEPLDGSASFGVATVGFDGTGHHSITSVLAGGAPPDGGADESANIRVEWRDANTIAWPQPAPNGAWTLVAASDVASSTPQALFECSGTTPHHVAFLDDGSVVAAFSPMAGAPVDLFVIAAGDGGACSVVRNLTNLVGGASRAHDFALSPDGKQIAFLRYDSLDGGGDPDNDGVLSLVPADGSSLPAPIGAPTVGRIGPRWIAAGSRLAWTRASDAGTGNPVYANAITVVQPDGGSAFDLDVGDGTTAIVAGAGPGGSCAMARGPTRSNAGVIVLSFLFLGVARRRRSASRHP